MNKLALTKEVLKLMDNILVVSQGLLCLGNHDQEVDYENDRTADDRRGPSAHTR